MLRKTFSGLIFIVLLTGILTSTINIQPVEASGTIYIRSDGSIDPPTAPISTVDNVTYTFTDNINDSIVVERSNIIIDGNGYTLLGNGSGNGFSLSYMNNVTIKNTIIKDFNRGVYLGGASYNILSGNDVANNSYAIYLYSSNNNIISENKVTNNTNDYGILLYISNNNTVFGNTITNNGIGVTLRISSDNIVSENKVTNNTKGIMLDDSSNHNIISGNNVANSSYGIWLTYFSNHNILSGNILTKNNQGMQLRYSSSNIISGNNITNNTYYGVLLSHSSNNTVSGNNITNNFQNGVRLYYSSDNMFYHNNFVNNPKQVVIDSESTSIWDDGYPSGGNYWSDYTGVDLYSGPYQNETGSDGICDHPYVIDMDNQDRYPLMNPWIPTSHKFRVGDWVQTMTNLNVREGPGLNYTIISTMALGTIGQILGGSVEADGFVWWDVNYAVGVRGWSVENWLELYPVLDQPPTCVVKLQKDGDEIDEIDVWEFFDIYVGDSTGDKGIKQVRFSSDNVQDGYPTGRWTEWYDWYVSSEDWNATTKIKRWTFATPGYKEVWAEVKDEINQTAVCLARIFVPAPALPVLTSPLSITPVKDIYNVGDSLEAEFTIKNIGDTAITLDVLTVGGRLNGFIPPEGAPDFTFQSVTLQPNESYQYQGSLTLTQTGKYRFFIAYYIENPTPDEEQLLDENNWNTCMELGEGLVHTDRVKNIIVYKEDVVPDDVIQLRNLINRLKGLDTYIPPYLLDDKSFGGSVATLWIYWKSFFTDAWETYDMHYFAGLDYEYLRVKSLVLAGRSLDSGDIEGARKLVQMSIEFGELSLRSFNGAFEVYDRNVEQAEATARFVKDRCQAIVVAGVTVWNPTAGKVLDYTFIITDYLINRELLGEEQATKILVRDTIVTTVFNEIPFFDGMTLSEYVKVNPSFKFTKMQNYIMNRQDLPDIIYDAIKELIAEEAENLSIMISDMLSSAVDYVQAEEFSPVEPRVYDSGGKIAGVIGGEVRHEISRSVYYNGTVTIFFPSDIYRYEIAGIDEGTYGLEITSVIAGNVTSLTATDIPTLPNATHQYTIDWNALSVGKEGVTVLVDSDGDGVVERIFSSDSDLTDGEFIEKTSPIYPTHTLTITTSEGGTTYPPPETYACSANSTVQVTALPDTDYILDHWELDGLNIGATNPISITIDTNHTMQAVFRVGLHDVAITNIAPSKTIVGQGYNMNINVTTANKGDCTETFNVTVYANTTIIGEIQVALNPTEETTIIFTWNTTGFALDNYTIWVYAEPVLGETNTSDNTFVNGWVVVTIAGDIDGDGDVDYRDLFILARAYGSSIGQTSYNANADLNGNGKIDYKDLFILARNYGKET